ncbi:MAG: hypothetical protein HQK79_20265 [Desulfobacterales bacterium]|nr:hypothetical protein [Desulfobacterales bacterium]
MSLPYPQITPIPNDADAVPELWNTRYAQIDENFEALYSGNNDDHQGIDQRIEDLDQSNQTEHDSINQTIIDLDKNNETSHQEINHRITDYFPKGTRLLFQQSVPPIGWVRETDLDFNDVALRVVTGDLTNGNGDLHFSALGGQKISEQGAVNTDSKAVTVSPTELHFTTNSVHVGIHESNDFWTEQTTLTIGQLARHSNHTKGSSPHDEMFGGGGFCGTAEGEDRYIDETGNNEGHQHHIGRHGHDTDAHGHDCGTSSHGHSSEQHYHTIDKHFHSLNLNLKYKDVIIGIKS